MLVIGGFYGWAAQAVAYSAEMLLNERKLDVSFGENAEHFDYYNASVGKTRPLLKRRCSRHFMGGRSPFWRTLSKHIWSFADVDVLVLKENVNGPWWPSNSKAGRENSKPVSAPAPASPAKPMGQTTMVIGLALAVFDSSVAGQVATRMNCLPVVVADYRKTFLHRIYLSVHVLCCQMIRVTTTRNII